MKAILKVLNGWRLNPVATLATLSVLTGTFTVIVMMALVHKNMGNVLSRWGTDAKLHVYLTDDADQTRQQEIKKELEQSGYFSTASFVSKKTAADLFRKKMGRLAPDLGGDKEDENPLPNSFEAVLKKDLRHSGGYEKLAGFAKRLAKAGGVEDVSYGQGWVENYASALKAFSMSSAFLVGVVLLGSIFIVGNAIQSSVAQRRDEIEIMELFGATPWMILRPFLLEGFLFGFLSAVAASVIGFAIFRWQAGLMLDTLQFWNLEGILQFLSFGRLAAFWAVGSLLGGAGSYFSVRRIGTGWAAAER